MKRSIDDTAERFDDPATVEYLLDTFQSRGFDATAEQTGPMAGAVEARLAAGNGNSTTGE